MGRRDGVEVVPGQEPRLRRLRVVVLEAEDPLPGRRPRRPRSHTWPRPARHSRPLGKATRPCSGWCPTNARRTSWLHRCWRQLYARAFSRSASRRSPTVNRRKLEPALRAHRGLGYPAEQQYADREPVPERRLRIVLGGRFGRNFAPVRRGHEGLAGSVHNGSQCVPVSRRCRYTKRARARRTAKSLLRVPTRSRKRRQRSPGWTPNRSVAYVWLWRGAALGHGGVLCVGLNAISRPPAA